MPITLPELCNKTFKDLAEETVASIPKYSGNWTNHNPSDPGIMILELICWISELSLYRINRVSDESYINFLQLVAGASGDEINGLLKDMTVDASHIKLLLFLKALESGEKKNRSDMKTAALEFLTSRYRAVTKEDFIKLAIEATAMEDTKVKRVIVNTHIEDAKVEVIIVSDSTDKYLYLKDKVKNYLAPRKLIGTIIDVKEPVYTPVEIDIGIVCEHYARPQGVEEKIRKSILKYLNPLKGGPDKDGWPYDRTLSVYEIYQIVEKTEGVKRSEWVKFDGDATILNKKIKGLISIVSEDITISVMEKK